MAEIKETPETSEGPGGKAPGDTSEDAEQGQVSAEVNKEACMWAMFCHLLGLAGLIYIMPVIGSIVGPLILWQIKRDEYPFVDEQGKEAVNFQVSMLLYAVVGSAVCAITCIGAPLIPVVCLSVCIVDIIFLLIAAVKANNGQHYRYPLTIRFIK